MTVYRWAASSSLFFGAFSTVLALEEVLPFPLLARRGSFAVFLGTSLIGIAVSLLALFLYPESERPPTRLSRRMTAFIGLGLNFWPWLHAVALLWFLQIGPP